jgi:hypothetical protein
VARSFDFYMPSLFQLETIPSSELARLKQGWPIKHHWTPPPNSYGVDFSQVLAGDPDGASGPYVRGAVNVSGGEIWPDPMPRFRTRLNP